MRGKRITALLKKDTFLMALLLAVSSLALVTSCGQQEKTVTIKRIEKPFTAKKQAEMQFALDSAVRKLNIPGAVVGIWIPVIGDWVRTSGMADPTKKRKMMPEYRFRIGSVTKTFTATVVMQLVDEGKLKLDDVLSGYDSTVPNAGTITIRQLLNHTSGIFNYTDDKTGFYQQVRKDPLRKYTSRQLVDIAIKYPPYFPPGQGWHYSNTNYVLLEMIVQKVTGNSLASEIESRVIDRLGLQNTSYPTGPTMPAPYSHGFWPANGDENKNADITKLQPSIAGGSGAMVSNLDDMKRWAKAFAQGELISKAMRDEQLRMVNMDETGVGKYGFGISEVNGLLGHGGGIYGFNCAVFYLPDKQSTFVLWVNKFPNPVVENQVMTILDDLIKVIFPQ